MVPLEEILDNFGTKSDLYNILVHDCKAVKQNKLIKWIFITKYSKNKNDFLKSIIEEEKSV